MNERKGEKLGWIGGWIGSFIWLIPVSIVWLIHNQTAATIILLLIFVLGITLTFQLTPWRYPTTYYYKLMLPNILLIYLSVAVCIYFFYELGNEKADWFLFIWLIVFFTPLITLGRRKWEI